MRLLEYQGKLLFTECGIQVPKGRVISSPDDARIAVDSLGGEAILKAQIPQGGRGKAGLIRVVESAHEAVDVARQLFDVPIVKELLVEERLKAEKELYLAVTVDNQGKIIMLYSDYGGVDIENNQNSVQMKYLDIDPVSPPPEFRLRKFFREAGLCGQILQRVNRTAHNLLILFFKRDLLVAEINPLFVLSDGRVIAGDAKVEGDENSASRQDFMQRCQSFDPLQSEARQIGVTYYKLNGDIGVIASGAGLAMGTMDILVDAGLQPANFLETGGGITEELMYRSVLLVARQGDVHGLVINLYGGVNPIEKGAAGIVRAYLEMDKPPVIIVKALGNKQEECWQILRQAGIPVNTTPRTEDAVRTLSVLLGNAKGKGGMTE